ncbi:MAG: BON domain-containing protein [Proteobacteria bacterium]|jgi:osmotically-inducible protein OsmY|nr:BON domain-containing protein [Pseudomonadota bacterium]
MHKSTILLILSLISIVTLNSCSILAIGVVATAAGTTAAVATDPRRSGTVVDDNTISTKLQNRISKDLPNSNIYVTCYNGAVLLTGQATTAKSKDKAEFDSKTIPGVKQIYNYLNIRLPQSFSSRTNDSFITTQIKTTLIGMSNISSNNIKVVTTESVVYLLGVVTKEQAKEIAKTAANINDVTKVVTLFEYKS